MQTVSAGFAALAAANIQQPLSYLEIAWEVAATPDPGGLFQDENIHITDARGAAYWTDESAYIVSHNGELKIEPPGEELVPAGDVGSLTLVLDNTDQRFSWLNTDSPLTTQINTAVGLAGIPVRLWQGYVVDGTPEYVRIFTGRVETWRESTAEGQITLTCRDWGFKYLQDKRSTALAVDQLPNEWTDQIATTFGVETPSQDVGIYPIPYCWMDDESIVEEIWQTWQADGGLAYFDQTGRLKGENALHWLSSPHDVSQWTLDESTYTVADPTHDIAAVATKVVVEWSGRMAGALATVYELDRMRTIMPLATETWTARYQHAVSSVVQPDPEEPFKDYWAQTAGGAAMNSQITIALTNEYAQQCTISVTNNSATAMVKLVFFQLRGFPLIGGPTEQEEALAVPSPLTYTRARNIRGNPYVQTKAQGAALAALKAVQCRRIRPIWKIQGVPGIPQLELGDRVTFKDTRALGSGLSRDAIVIGISWDGGLERGFVQSLRLWDIEDIAEYASYFRVGVDTLGAHERCYY